MSHFLHNLRVYHQLIKYSCLRSAVELGRQYFPNCSYVIDKFLEEEATDLALHESDKPEDQPIKRMRFYKIKERAQKAYNKDMAAAAAIPSTGSSSSSLRYERNMTKKTSRQRKQKKNSRIRRRDAHHCINRRRSSTT
jgi:regulatory protein NPR1